MRAAPKRTDTTEGTTGTSSNPSLSKDAGSRGMEQRNGGAGAHHQPVLETTYSLVRLTPYLQIHPSTQT